jgi:hypothetical protein
MTARPLGGRGDGGIGRGGVQPERSGSFETGVRRGSSSVKRKYRNQLGIMLMS